MACCTIRGIRAQHQHFTVRHIDDAQQAVGDSQPQRGQQQHRTEGKPHKRLTQQIAPHQAVRYLIKALFGSGANAGVRLSLRTGIRGESGHHVRIVGLA